MARQNKGGTSAPPSPPSAGEKKESPAGAREKTNFETRTDEALKEGKDTRELHKKEVSTSWTKFTTLVGGILLLILAFIYIPMNYRAWRDEARAEEAREAAARIAQASTQTPYVPSAEDLYPPSVTAGRDWTASNPLPSGYRTRWTREVDAEYQARAIVDGVPTEPVTFERGASTEVKRLPQGEAVQFRVTDPEIDTLTLHFTYILLD